MRFEAICILIFFLCTFFLYFVWTKTYVSLVGENSISFIIFCYAVIGIATYITYFIVIIPVLDEFPRTKWFRMNFSGLYMPCSPGENATIYAVLFSRFNRFLKPVQKIFLNLSSLPTRPLNSVWGTCSKFFIGEHFWKLCPVLFISKKTENSCQGSCIWTKV